MNHPDHICRFNDAPQTCECYDAGYKDGVAEERERVRGLIEKEKDYKKTGWIDDGMAGRYVPKQYRQITR